MQAGVAGFAHGVEAGQVGLAIEVGDHAAAGVVGRGHHWNRLGGNVDAERRASRMNVRKVFFEECLAKLGRIEVHVVQAMALHLEVDGTGHDVARGEFGAGIVLGHEAGAVGQLQGGAFTAQGLGDEEAAVLRVVEAGGVELNELHVGNATACAPGHGHAITGGSLGVAGVAIDLAHTARGQHYAGCGHGLHMTGLEVQGIEAVAGLGRLGRADPAVGQVPARDEVDGHPALEQSDVRVGTGLVEQHLMDGLAGGVGCMRNAPMAVAAFLHEVQAFGAGGVGGEGHTVGLEPPDGLGTVLGNVACHRLDHQACAGIEGVVHMGLDVVLLIEHAHDAALGPGGGRLGQAALGENDHGLLIRQFKCHREAREARAHDEQRQSVTRLRRGIGRGARQGVWARGHGCAQKRRGCPWMRRPRPRTGRFRWARSAGLRVHPTVGRSRPPGNFHALWVQIGSEEYEASAPQALRA